MGDIELTPKNRIIFEWELMKSINRLADEWDEILSWFIHEKVIGDEYINE